MYKLNLQVIFLFCLLAFGCNKNQEEAFVTVKVERGTVQNVISVTGRAESANQITIISPDDLTVTALTTSNGQKVKAGDLLCSLDPTNALEVIRQEEEKLAQMDSQIRMLEIRLQGLRKNSEKYKNLYKSGAVSLDEMEQHGQELKIQETQFNADVNLRKTSMDQIKKAKDKSQLLQIRSPIDGIVTYTWVNQDSFISGSSIKKGDLLFRVASVGKMHLRATLREQDVNNFAIGQKLEIVFPALADYKLNGQISYIDNAATVDKDSGVSSFKMNIEFQPDDKIRPGMEAFSDFIVDKKANVVMIPKSAVNPYAGSVADVVVLRGDMKIHTKVNLGLVGDENVEVLSGLNEGETILATYE